MQSEKNIKKDGKVNNDIFLKEDTINKIKENFLN